MYNRTESGNGCSPRLLEQSLRGPERASPSDFPTRNATRRLGDEEAIERRSVRDRIEAEERLTPIPSFFNDLAQLKWNQDAANLVGFPRAYAQVFMQIVREQQCVISSRQIGRHTELTTLQRASSVRNHSVEAEIAKILD